MCGIAGVLNLNGMPVDAALVERMTTVLAHRGPDGSGIQTNGAMGFGHRRLSIIDLSPNGAQPMPNEDHAFWITFNGEIYNHQTLRDDLVQKGHQFISQTDTEAILHGFEEYGIDVLQRLNGMFAFAIWDAAEQTLWLARDRLGIKPLFYAQFDDVFLFGSEIKAILEHPAARREIDHDALDLFLSLNYTPVPYTMLRGVRQLRPGEWLRVRVGGDNLVCQSYWDVDYSQQSPLSLQDAQNRFEDLFAQAVKRRLMADVPLGAFLSGGIDSSAVVASMTDATAVVKTFSIGFNEASFNEAPFAELVANHLKTHHHEKIVTPQLAEVLPKIVWHGEDPLADASMIPMYYLAQMTREQVTVALAGDGADEILAGYPTYLATKWANRLAFLPNRALQKTVLPLLNVLPPSEGKLSKREKISRLLPGLGLNWRDAHAVWRQILSPEQKQAILKNPPSEQLFATYRGYYDQSGTDDLLHQLLYVDTRFYLPSDMLVKVDRMTMAHSLEARVPFLDHELVAFAASLPPNYKLKGTIGKFILRQAMMQRLPQTTLNRSKAGFNIPVSKWLRTELAERLHDTLSAKKLNETGLFNPKAIQKMITDHQSKRVDHGYALWGLLVFMIWWEQFMEGHKPS